MKKSIRILCIFVILLIYILVSAYYVKPANSTETGNKIHLESMAEVRYLNPVFDNVDIQKDVPYKEQKTNQSILDIYQPKGDSVIGREAVVLIHGGGFIGGDKADLSELAIELAKRGYFVVSINYTLAKAPLTNFEKAIMDGVNDTIAAVNWIKKNNSKYRVDLNKIAVGGASAGGYISVEAALNQQLQGKEKNFFAVIDMFGGLSLSIPSKTSPPVIMIHGDKDQTVSYNESVHLKQLLDEKGVLNELFTMKGAGHGIPESYKKEVLDEISRFLYKASDMNVKQAYSCINDPITVALGERFKVKLKKLQNVKFNDMLIHIPKSWKISNSDITPKSDGSLEFEVNIPIDSKNEGEYYIVIEPKTDKKAGVFRTLVNLKVVEPVNVSVDSRIDTKNKNAVQKLITVHNNSLSSIYSGTIEVTGYSSKKQEFPFSSLKAGERREYLLSQDTYGYNDFSVKLKNGYENIYNEGVFITNAIKTDSPPVIDGDIGEWVNKPSFSLDNENLIKRIADWKGKDDLSCNVYLMWDYENLYVAADVKDNIHNQEFTGDSLWNGDSIQFSIDRKRSIKPGIEGTDEFGFSLTNSGNVDKWRWIASDGHSIGADFDSTCVVKRIGTDTVYEISIPWKEILASDVKPSNSSLLGFSFLVNDNDGGDRRGWIEFSGGIGGGEKDPAIFGEVYLVD